MISNESKGTILIIDNTPMTYQIVSGILSRFPYDIHSIMNGKEAFDFALNQPPQIILLDNMLSDLDSFDLCKQFKNNPNTKSIPIIFIITQMDSNIIKKCFQTGAADYISKPFNRYELLTRVQTQLELYNLRQRVVTLTNQLSKARKISLHPKKRTLDGMHILLVEDDAINRKIVSSIVQKNMGHASLATNGIEGVELIKQAMIKMQNSKTTDLLYDMIIMDIEMPEMNGLEATKRIREIERSYQLNQSIPIIAMTSHQLPEEINQCLNAGMNDHVKKPIEPNVLISTLMKYIPQKCSNQSISNLEDNDSSILVNFKEGLSKVSMNEDLYYNIINEFVESFREAPHIMNKMITDNAMASLKQYVHNLSGVSGNIGAYYLYEIAKKLEYSINSVDKDVFNDLFDQFKTVFNQSMSLIQEYSEANISEHNVKINIESETKTNNQLIVELFQLLKNNDLNADQSVEKLLKYYHGTSTAQDILKIQHYISIFDYKGATSFLTQLAQNLNIEL